MSHAQPYYAYAPLGQAPTAPMAPTAPTAPTAMTLSSAPMTLYSMAGTAASIALGYHGFRRTWSIGWALAWALVGGLVWPASLGIAWAQGFGRPASVRRNRKRSRR